MMMMSCCCGEDELATALARALPEHRALMEGAARSRCAVRSALSLRAPQSALHLRRGGPRRGRARAAGVGSDAAALIGAEAVGRCDLSSETTSTLSPLADTAGSLTRQRAHTRARTRTRPSQPRAHARRKRAHVSLSFCSGTCCSSAATASMPAAPSWLSLHM